MKKFTYYLLAYAAVTFLLGFWLGTSRSPDWNDPQQVQAFFRESVTLTAVEQDAVDLSVVCGPQLYSFNSRTGRVRQAAVAVEILHDLEEISPARAGGLFLAIVGFTVSSDESGAFIAAAIVVIAGAAIVGHDLGYDATPDCDAVAMADALQGSAKWEEFATQHLEVRRQVLETPVQDYCASRPRWFRIESAAQDALQSQFAEVTNHVDREILDHTCAASPSLQKTTLETLAPVRQQVMSTTVSDYCSSSLRWYWNDSDDDELLQLKFAAVTNSQNLGILDELCDAEPELAGTSREALASVRQNVLATPLGEYCDSRPRWYRWESDADSYMQQQFSAVAHPLHLELLDAVCKAPSQDTTTMEALTRVHPDVILPGEDAHCRDRPQVFGADRSTLHGC